MAASALPPNGVVAPLDFNKQLKKSNLQLHLLRYWREGVPYLFLIPFYNPLGFLSYSSDNHVLN